MKRRVSVWGIVLMIALVSSYATGAQKTAVQPADTTNQVAVGTQDVTAAAAATTVQEETAAQVVIGAQDAVTASDAGGGTLSSRDLIIIIAVGVGILVLIAIL